MDFDELGWSDAQDCSGKSPDAMDATGLQCGHDLNGGMDGDGIGVTANMLPMLFGSGRYALAGFARALCGDWLIGQLMILFELIAIGVRAGAPGVRHLGAPARAKGLGRAFGGLNGGIGQG